MFIFSREKDQGLIIDDNIKIKVIGFEKDCVLIGIEGHKDNPLTDGEGNQLMPKELETS